jgi:hypothetical protein
LQLITDFSSFTLILIAGMLYLFTQHDLKLYEIITAIVLLVITIGLSVIISLGLINPSFPQRLMTWLQSVSTKIAQRFKRKSWLSEDWAKKNAEEFTNASLAIARHPKRLARTLAAAFAAHLIEMTSLYMLFLAFGYPIQFGPLLAGYTMGILFWVVSICALTACYNIPTGRSSSSTVLECAPGRHLHCNHGDHQSIFCSYTQLTIALCRAGEIFSFDHSAWRPSHRRHGRIWFGDIGRRFVAA